MGKTESAVHATPPASTGSKAEFWMPFTANRDFKSDPKMVVRAEGMYYWSEDGRQIIDASSGLFCVNAGHARTEITESVARQLAELDFVPQSADISEYADGGAHVLRVVYAYPGGANDGFVYVDDVSVDTSPATVEPLIGVTSIAGNPLLPLQRKR